MIGTLLLSKKSQTNRRKSQKTTENHRNRLSPRLDQKCCVSCRRLPPCKNIVKKEVSCTFFYIIMLFYVVLSSGVLLQFVIHAKKQSRRTSVPVKLQNVSYSQTNVLAQINLANGETVQMCEIWFLFLCSDWSVLSCSAFVNVHVIAGLNVTSCTHIFK